MKQFQIKNLSQIPLEGTHNLPDSRQTLATKADLVTDNLDALTKGFLKPGQCWDWHLHDLYDELGMVLQGEGFFYCEDEKVRYKKDDIISIPAKSNHKFEATGTETSEFYFVRIKV